MGTGGHGPALLVEVDVVVLLGHALALDGVQRPDQTIAAEGGAVMVHHVGLQQAAGPADEEREGRCILET